MQIRVKLFATFRQYLPPHAQGGGCDMAVPTGTCVSQVLAHFNIPQDDPGHFVVLINGRQSDLDTVVSDGDVVSAFPAMAGG